VETDLNRCFSRQDLDNPNLTSYEALRAKIIDHQFGPKSDRQVDLAIDVHSTTANMGLTLIFNGEDPLILKLAAHLATMNPNVRMLRSLAPGEDKKYVDSLRKVGCSIEVGAVAQNVLNAALFQQTEALLHTILDFVDAYNRGISLPLADSFWIYQNLGGIDYPRDESGDIQSMVHPQLQFRDYEPLVPGDPMFLTFTGETIVYEGKKTIYPVFINEAAYYEKGIVMSCCDRSRFDVAQASLDSRS
jgi:aspartoacylase